MTYPLIHIIHKERKKEAKKERKATATTNPMLHFYFGKNVTFLNWLDTTPLFPCYYVLYIV